jgi:hypothetical protein
VPNYRAYKISPAGKIVSGDWIVAADDLEARSVAHELCDEATPQVEVWEGPRRVAVLPCDDGVAAA